MLVTLTDRDRDNQSNQFFIFFLKIHFSNIALTSSTEFDTFMTLIKIQGHVSLKKIKLKLGFVNKFVSS